ncbi:hypothetical protein Bsub01_02001 [Bacillus subtilis]|nr:hypothetical protein BSBS38_03472 [Bacillus subtilis]ARW33210.1 hypothetical protein S101441_03690 [Bacillus subtilis subsp. subtilis]ASB71494.1 hypothetical protein S100333_03630 [Bacillus subtilis subsp. subtilis]POD87800.1 hypothetical protein S101384_00497 [Bacillus subtilis subsp. subtilis]BAO93575.1 hypothetical protein BSNT_09935 [Bacillus subtilis subsp. natto BEST195]
MKITFENLIDNLRKEINKEKEKVNDRKEAV